MVSPKAVDRLSDFVAAATEILIEKGYRRTKMADVTRSMGLSEGSIYRYFESKKALFDLVLRVAADPDAPLVARELPVPTPPPGATLEFVRRSVADHARMRALERALGDEPAADAVAELRGIVEELFTKIARFRVGVRIIDRSALDWPELAEFWFGETRTGLVEMLAVYLDDRMRRGLLRPVPDATAAARLILELNAYFAMHRHWDPVPTPIDEPTARRTLVDNVVHAYAV